MKYTEFLRWLADQKHLMIAGASGSGKSVLLNQIITYGIVSRRPFDEPDGAQVILIDPKRVELIRYANLPHTLVHATEPQQMVEAIQTAMSITEERYRKMMKNGQTLYEGSDVYVLIDEFADLMTTNRKQVQPLIQRLAQIGRAARVHVILCTQCPIAKVIPTEIKCNFDSVVGLSTARASDSRNIIGMSGLETLPQYGQCVVITPDNREPTMYPVYAPNREAEEQILSCWRKSQPKRAGFFQKLFA